MILSRAINLGIPVCRGDGVLEILWFRRHPEPLFHELGEGRPTGLPCGGFGKLMEPWGLHAASL